MSAAACVLVLHMGKAEHSAAVVFAEIVQEAMKQLAQLQSLHD